MDYAIQLLIPIALGLWLGTWLSQNLGWSPLWTVFLTIWGMVAGLVIMARRMKQDVARKKALSDEAKATTNPSDDTHASNQAH